MKHLLIPDLQIHPGCPTEHLSWIGQYIVDKKPDVIIQIGDFADMHSLSSYDKSTVKAEGARYHEDVYAANEGMVRLMEPMVHYNAQQARTKHKQYKPRMILTLGNHENRINRYANANPEVSGFVSTEDFEFKSWGWEVYPFLEVVEVDGILYSHFFPRNAKGQVMQSIAGAPSAQAQVIRQAQSSTSGHKQGLDFHIQQTQSRRMYGLIAGSCYLHEEDYLTPQGTAYWRGIVMKHDVHNGEYDAMFVSLDYLRKRYE